ncbi:hypothetical protein [Acidocella aminolytica]|uniref:Uncharacterized protein n=1 Tax=Acidocella aminolytica 101 = DSM 11237 TaxID=1120923 RepID=A0A0D6PIH7_9PROT|nr:hypothetical protein [Acidocella aminolytica]GAN81472.1 hypothetical protein Aam_096_031 [Acidocella aminolytica 101 = DSM 11237]GBQ35008.1 hypothetical protein AA11237_0877 [Acidocella aminolytica 101 = DSM 11237]
MKKSRLIRLHVIAKSGQQSGNLTHIGGGVFESGRWHITPDIAEKAIGAELHLHEYQDKTSWFAGIILGWRPADVPDRVFFKLKKNPGLSKSQKEGWGNEQSRVWEE